MEQLLQPWRILVCSTNVMHAYEIEEAWQLKLIEPYFLPSTLVPIGEREIMSHISLPKEMEENESYLVSQAMYCFHEMCSVVLTE